MSVSLWVYFINRHNEKIPRCSFLMNDAGVLAEIDPKKTELKARDKTKKAARFYPCGQFGRNVLPLQAG